jgi:uncharacterized protein YkwD
MDRTTPHLLRRLVASSLIALLAVAVLSSTGSATASSISASTATVATSAASDAESSFLGLLNQARAQAGLPAMQGDGALGDTSRSWSANMSARDQLYHDPNLAAAVSSVEPNWRSAGENVGVGYGVQQLHDAFMNSAGHRANVLSPKFNRVGVGVVYNGTKIWVTFRFIEGPTLTVTAAPAPVREPAPEVPIQGMDLACPEDSTPPTSFTDLWEAIAHARGVTCATAWGVATGRTSTEFEPTAPMNRAQMATFIARTLEEAGVALPSSPPDAFTDDEGSLHELRINQLASLGVVRGRTSSTYGPYFTVTRAEMATFLVRAHDQAAADPLPAGVDRFFDDDGSTHEANINKVGQAGLAAGTSETTFAPKTAVTRGQMATFLSRTLDRFVEDGDVAPL